MLTVSLNGLEFRAFHGIRKEERILGNDYRVNCTVQIEEPQKLIRRIEETVNYQRIFEIIRDQMAISTPLLETVCMRTGSLIREQMPLVRKITISVEKLHPPIDGFFGSCSVLWEKEFYPAPDPSIPLKK